MKKFLILTVLCSCLLSCVMSRANNTFLTEGFENPGYENIMCDTNISTSCWTELIDANCLIDDALECDCYPPEHGDYCFYAYSNGPQELSRAVWRLDEVSQSNHVSFRIRVVEHNLTNTKVIQPVVLTTNAGSKLVTIQLYYYNGQMFVNMRYWDGYGTVSSSDFYPIDEYEWNLIEFKYDLDKLKTSLKLNHKMVFKDKNMGGDHTTNPRKLFVGIHYNNGLGPASIEISSLEWDD